MPRPKLEDARDRLLAAGLSLFAQRGMERVNSNTIAKRAKVGIGTFYNHFPDKYALLRELELRTLAGVRAARVAALEAAGPGLAAQVRGSIEAAVGFAAAHPEAYRVTFGRERAGAGHHGPVVTESARPLANALRRLQSRGRVDPRLDPELGARAYLAMEVGMLLWWLEDRKRAEPGQLVETLVRLHPAGRAAA